MTGSVRGTPYGNLDFLTLKYDSDGNRLWAITSDAGGTERGKRIAIDPSGDILVTGSAANWYGVLTVKYTNDTNGGPPTAHPLSDLQLGAVSAVTVQPRKSHLFRNGQECRKRLSNGVHNRRLLSPTPNVSHSDYRVATLSTASLSAGGQQLFTGTVAVPPTAPYGMYYVTAIADVNNTVQEADETNNGAVGNHLLLGDDLSITALQGT